LSWHIYQKKNPSVKAKCSSLLWTLVDLRNY